MKTISLLNLFLGKKLEAETGRYLAQLAKEKTTASRRETHEFLARMQSAIGRKVVLGETTWGEPVTVQLETILKACGIFTGGMGAGKTQASLLIFEAVLDAIIAELVNEKTTEPSIGIGGIDMKGDFYDGALYLIERRLDDLSRRNPAAAKKFRQQIFLCSFASRNPITSYNILARWPGVDPDFFSANRADLLLDLLPGPDRLSLGGVGVLNKLISLLSEHNLPITRLSEVLRDEHLLSALVARSRNQSLQTYFANSFASVPKSTLAAIERRMEALFASESVRLALAGPTAPDFRRLQDESKIVLVNCFGEQISRGVRRLLQALVLSDMRQAVFARTKRENVFLAMVDEAQNLFLSEGLRDNMADLLTMSRSFGSYFLLLTQNMTTAVQDARMFRILMTNIRWALSLRGDPADCAFLKPLLPVSGTRLKPKWNPFADSEYYSPTEERTMALDEIANLPDRVGWFWLKGGSAEAVKIRTRDIDIPRGRELDQATQAIRCDPTIGMRYSRKEYERLIAERDRNLRTEPESEDFDVALKDAYRRSKRGTTA